MVRLGCAALVSVAAVCALVPLRSHVVSANLALILVLVVLGIAVAGGRAAGVVAGIVTAIAFDFFLTVPYGVAHDRPKRRRADDGAAGRGRAGGR